MTGGADVVDTHATIFRIDLRETGWNLEPFVKMTGDGKENGKSKVNLFDVALLEYPHLRVPEGSPVFEKVAARHLKPANQVRPAAFVRGDWFVQATSTSPLADDLAKLLKLGDDTPPGLKSPKPKVPSPPKPITGALWAVDAWHGPDPADDAPVKGLKVEIVPDGQVVKGLKVETIDFSRNMPRTKFYGGERFRLRISADEKMVFQLVWLSAKGQVYLWPPPEEFNSPGKAWETVLPPDDDVLDPNELGDEKLMVFASKEKFPNDRVPARKTWESSVFITPSLNSRQPPMASPPI